ncbi:unnamed protein product [Discosporangium mesarthrocarpum]
MSPAMSEPGLYNSDSGISASVLTPSGRKLVRPRSFQGAIKPIKSETDDPPFDLEGFKQRLAQGFSLTKHSRSGKASPRIIYTVDGGKHFLMAKEKGSGVLSMLTPSFPAAEYSIHSLAKVRMGTEKDPESETLTGSNPLRMGCPTPEDLKRGFSLVYLCRTLDFTASTPDEMQYIVKGFRKMVAEEVGDVANRNSGSWVRK